MTRMVAVIGGSGFLGTRLCELLRAAGQPFVIVDKRVSESFPDECVVADVRDADALERVLPSDAVWINLAAEHRDDVTPRSLYHDVNVEGARNICRAAAVKDVRSIVFTSSVACYGNAPAGTGEDGAIAPFNDYGRTKFLAEEVFREWQGESPATRSLAIVRPTVIFGERNRGNVYNLLRQIASGRFVMVGAGRNVKSMAYVGNVAAFLAFLAGEERGNVLVNYVDEPSIDMNTLVGIARQELAKPAETRLRLPVWLGMALGRLADVAAAVSGRKLPVSAVRVRKFVSDSHFAAGYSRLGFQPPFTMLDALRRTVRFEFASGNVEGEVFYTE